MLKRIFIHAAVGTTFASVALVSFACSDYASPTTPGALSSASDVSVTAVEPSVKPNEQFNEKFTFDPVTFGDDITGVIEAGSKRTKNSEFTVCSYFTAGTATSSGSSRATRSARRTTEPCASSA